MNRLKRPILFLFIAMVSFGALQAPSTAQQPPELSASQLVKIRNRCGQIQDTLNHVHANDALVRVNRGQLYELISTKLMARLNSRIALNRLDSSSLVSVSANYENHLADFRSNYQEYEVLLSNTMKIDCADQPTRFYDKLQETREKRSDVYESTQLIADDVKAYQKAFGNFREAFRKSTL